MNQLAWLEVKDQIGKESIESLMPDQGLGLLRFLRRKMMGLRSSYETEVTNIREKKESKGLYSHFDANMDLLQGMGREPECLPGLEKRSQVWSCVWRPSQGLTNTA